MNKKEFILSDKVKIGLDLETKDYYAVISAFDAHNFAVPFDISYYVTENVVRMNLQKKLKLSKTDTKTTKYTFVDETGESHIFEEKYYYLFYDKKIYFHKSLASIDLNGNLTYDGREVKKEQVCEGYTLIPEIRGFKDCELIEQRQEEQIKLEEYIKSCESTFKNYVAAVADTGEIRGHVRFSSKEDFHDFINLINFDAEYSDTDYIFLSESEALQLQSLYLSLSIKSGLKEEEDEKQKKIYKDQIQLLIDNARGNQSAVIDLYNKYYVAQEQLKILLLNTPVNFIKDKNGIISGFNRDGNLVCMIDSYNNTVAFEYGSNYKMVSVYDSNGKIIKFDYIGANICTITDGLGRTTEIKYKNALNGIISKVSFADGSNLEINYTDNNTTFTENGEKETIIHRYSDIPIYEISQSYKNSQGFSSFVRVIYNSSEVTLTYDSGLIEIYGVNEDGKILSYEEKVGDKTTEITYSYSTEGKEEITTKTTKNYYGNKTTAKIEETEEAEKVDCNKNLLSRTVDWQALSDSTSVKTEINYTYNEDGELSEIVEIKHIKTNGTDTQQKKKTKYAYNLKGSLAKTESFIEGEEEKFGRNITEYEYDDKGRAIKSVSWNTLDSSTKFYSENVCAENWLVTEEKNELGETSAEYEYKAGTSVVNSVKYPNESKLSYGRNPNNFNLTSVTHSTEDGEANTTDISYDINGRISSVKSGSTVFNYTYDYKDRVSKISKGDGNVFIENRYTEDANSGETSTVTVYASRNGDGQKDKIRTVKDIHGNVLKVDYGYSANAYGSLYLNQITNEYEKGKLIKSTDGVTKATCSFTYDSYERMIQRTTNSSTEYYSYDSYGKLSAKTISGEVNHIYFYEYNELTRNLSNITLPSGAKCYPLTDVYGRNTGKELKTAAGVKISSENITYRKRGDHGSNIPCTVWYGSGSVIKDNIHYKYDNMGNISEITKNGVLVAKYTYDALNRIVRENNKALGLTYTFSYDNNGNIVYKGETNFTLKPDLDEKYLVNMSYCYEGDKLTGVNHSTGKFEYDNIGNPTKFAGKTLVWSKVRQLVKYGDTEIKYDSYGKRIKKGDTTFTYDGNGNLIKQSDGFEFYYDHTGVAGFTYAEETYYYRKDAQGNIIAILDSNGEVVVEYVYDAWGNHRVVDKFGVEIKAGSHVGNLNPFRYRGYYYDKEFDLYYLQTRYYSPVLCRFINADSIDYANPQTINGLNLYAYCNNNPVMYVDPNGRFLLSFLTGLAVSSLIGWAISEIVGAQIASGVSSIANGAFAVQTGVSLLSFGPVGWVSGGALILIGAGTILFGVNETVAGVTGTNYLQSWGMSESLYNGMYIGLNIASAVGTIAGNVYMKYANVSGTKVPGTKGKPFSRYATYGENGVKQYRFFDGHGNAWYDVDFSHPGKNLIFPHYHGWINGSRVKDHWTFWQFILWLLFGG